MILSSKPLNVSLICGDILSVMNGLIRCRPGCSYSLRNGLQILLRVGQRMPMASHCPAPREPEKAAPWRNFSLPLDNVSPFRHTRKHDHQPARAIACYSEIRRSDGASGSWLQHHGRTPSVVHLDLVRHQLRLRHVLFLHLDEAQDLSSLGTARERNAIASMLKTLMTDEQWPVGILLSGTEELEDILNHDPQLARRMDTVHFAPLSPVAHARDVMGLIEGYAKRADIIMDPTVSDRALAERLIHSAAFQFGLVIEIIIAAIEIALLEEATALKRRHFVTAYQLRSSCSDAFNRSSSLIFIALTPAKSSSGRVADVVKLFPTADDCSRCCG